ncbi:MAG TPA: winged-helix domain-containing protein [Candidatus Magasanikbacteria bacterium]|nr:winged-helix domain-containing protein [Candidatus Magasanikbacteria bacterium]
MVELNQRQRELLRAVVDAYIESAEPVGSQSIARKSGLDLSEATIRNELRDLEDLGVLTHPHTSAGRIPTEEGYKYYVTNLMRPNSLRTNTRDEMKQIFSSAPDNRVGMKMGVRYVSDLIGAAVIVAWDRNSLFYAGLSSLFSEPEFHDFSRVADFSRVFDHCEERLPMFLEVVGFEPTILIGSDNPFGAACGTVAIRFAENGLLAFMGPMRMDYARAFSFINFFKEEILNKQYDR